VARYHKLKKLIAVLFLSMFLLNIGGGIVVHQYLVLRSDDFFNRQISHGLYNVHDLTEVKIPINMPGMADWGGYEKMLGEVRFAHTAYNYVAIKMTRNAIYLQCVPNYKTTRLSGQNIIHAESLPDIPVAPKQHVPYSKISILSHFNLAINCFEFTAAGQNTPLVVKYPTNRQTCRYPDIPEQPPQYHC
jgi:hypothetical protein